MNHEVPRVHRGLRSPDRLQRKATHGLGFTRPQGAFVLKSKPEKIFPLQNARLYIPDTSPGAGSRAAGAPAGLVLRARRLLCLPGRIGLILVQSRPGRCAGSFVNIISAKQW